MRAIILEIDEELKNGEELECIRTVGIKDGVNSYRIAYLAVIITPSEGLHVRRYGSVRAVTIETNQGQIF